MPESNVGRWAAVRQAVGIDELVLLAGLSLITIGLWSFCGVAALIAPGAVLIFIALPSRASFVVPPPAKNPPVRRIP